MSYGGGFPPSNAPRPPEPDWAALADRNEQASRRRRWVVAAGAGGAVLVVAAAVVVGVQALGGSGSKGSALAGSSASPAASQSASASPVPSTPPSVPPTPVAVRLTDGRGGVPLTVASGATVHPGNGSKVLWLDGSPEAYADAPGPVVDTARSFTVSAWVLDKAPTGAVMAISQGQGGYYTFALGRDYWPGHESWVFKVQSAAGDQDKTTYPVYAKSPAALNTWVLLTGTYDAAHRTIALYVNGKLQQQAKVPGIWRNAGALQVGRVAYKGQWTDNWNGILGHVQVWNAALTPAQAAAAVKDRSGVVPAHSWLVS
ncbi:LamG domain-containing protein [Streptacidiphilus sp. MAP5-3]|uniref:LamG domain-containing protein n=1 Tax=unclassified Streptacidiphilus TaxID=2643834 RepID=UPI0035143A12